MTWSDESLTLSAELVCAPCALQKPIQYSEDERRVAEEIERERAAAAAAEAAAAQAAAAAAAVAQQQQLLGMCPGVLLLQDHVSESVPRR